MHLVNHISVMTRVCVTPAIMFHVRMKGSFISVTSSMGGSIMVYTCWNTHSTTLPSATYIIDMSDADRFTDSSPDCYICQYHQAWPMAGGPPSSSISNSTNRFLEECINWDTSTSINLFSKIILANDIPWIDYLITCMSYCGLSCIKHCAGLLGRMSMAVNITINVCVN